MESPGLPKCKKSTTRSPKVLVRHKNVPQGAKKTEAHIDTNNQPTKETKRHTNQQTTKQTHKQRNKHTHTHTHKQTPNNKTTSFELQTQTQTSAAGCSPKAT